MGGGWFVSACHGATKCVCGAWCGVDRRACIVRLLESVQNNFETQPGNSPSSGGVICVCPILRVGTQRGKTLRARAPPLTLEIQQQRATSNTKQTQTHQQQTRQPQQNTTTNNTQRIHSSTTNTNNQHPAPSTSFRTRAHNPRGTVEIPLGSSP